MSPGRGIDAEWRALLARKGEVLYAKSCGTEGRGGCVEGFAIHQLRIGNEEVVRDFLRFLEGRLVLLESDDPEGLRGITEDVVGRIRGHLEATPDGPTRLGDPRGLDAAAGGSGSDRGVARDAADRGGR